MVQNVRLLRSNILSILNQKKKDRKEKKQHTYKISLTEIKILR